VSRAGARWRRYGPAVALVAAGIAVWEAAIRALRVPDYLLPAPSAIAGDFSADGRLLLDNSLVTLREMALGFALAVAAGLALAVVLHLSGTLRRALYPVLIGSQTVPVVVLAPILVILLGFDLAPKLAIVALICFFPITVNLLDGLRSAPPELLKLMRSMGASRLRTLRSVELPSALPSLFSGLKIAATVSVIGAVFAEWAGADEGLGRLVLLGNNQLQTPRVYAGIVILTLMAVGLFAVTALAERVAVPWNRKDALP
jgi:ABC-type nitrate/sulfonate/bicarbonate transport system permease component